LLAVYKPNVPGSNPVQDMIFLFCWYDHHEINGKLLMPRKSLKRDKISPEMDLFSLEKQTKTCSNVLEISVFLKENFHIIGTSWVGISFNIKKFNKSKLTRISSSFLKKILR